MMYSDKIRVQLSIIVTYLIFGSQSQKLYMGFQKNVDTTQNPDMYAQNYLSNLQPSGKSSYNLTSAYFIGDTVFYTFTSTKNVRKGIVNAGLLAIEEDRVIHVFNNRKGYSSCELSNISQDVWHTGRVLSRKRLDIIEGYFIHQYNELAEGRGVSIYVMDTGVRKSHNDFGERATWGFIAPSIATIDGTEDDLEGHGTHVAALAGGEIYGIARNASIVSVKVLNKFGSGSISALIEGIAFATEDATRKAKTSRKNVQAICNLSLGEFGESPTLSEAIKQASNEGLIFVVAAGNDDDGSCFYYPGNIDETITVAGSDINDNFYSNSNYGSCVDIIAPAVNIMSAGISSDFASSVLTGTSMATPIVAGALAVHISRNPDQLMDHVLALKWIQNTATTDAINIPGHRQIATINKLLFLNCSAYITGKTLQLLVNINLLSVNSSPFYVFNYSIIIFLKWEFCMLLQEKIDG